LKPPPIARLSAQGCTRTIAVEKGQWSNRHMAVEVFKQVIDHLPQVGMATLLGRP